MVGRQGILDVRQQLVAYELLYRDSVDARSANHVDDVAATATVVVRTVAEIGLEVVASGHDLYLNCNEAVLQLPLAELLPPERVVLEVLESVPFSPQLTERLEELRGLGFRIALDDYEVGDARAGLLDFADVVKVDLRAVAASELPGLVERLSQRKVTLLAEKVEEFEEFERCRALGFELFQGYFFCKPRVVSAKSAGVDHGLILGMLAELQSPDTTIDSAVALISRDLGVSYRLMRCLKSPVFGLRGEVDSLRQGLILLGMPRVRAWVTVMALSGVRGKSSELLRMALVRAAMCRDLAAGSGLSPDVMFTVGMFSLLHAFLDMEREDVVRLLPLGPAVRGAILGEDLPETLLLASVVDYERGRFSEATLNATTEEALQRVWLEAIAWADLTLTAIG